MCAARREEYVRLLDEEGMNFTQAAHAVGVSKRTGKAWRNGRTRATGGGGERKGKHGPVSFRHGQTQTDPRALPQSGGAHPDRRPAAPGRFDPRHRPAVGTRPRRGQPRGRAQQESRDRRLRDLPRPAEGGRPAQTPQTAQGGRRHAVAGGDTGRVAQALEPGADSQPAEAEDRAVPGHWEGDLITGSRNKSAIGTLVERTTRFTILLHLPDGHDAEHVQQAIIDKMQHLPKLLRNSLTWDQGAELALHKRIGASLDMAVYFCDPHSPWQRGTNENTNGLLRQYFPKGTDLSVYPEDYLDAVAEELNDRPRKTLGFMRPSEKIIELLDAA